MYIDQQTLRDLDILPTQAGEPSLFDLLNHTRTNGGRRRLKQVLRSPLADMTAIRARQELLQYLGQQRKHWEYILDNTLLSAVECYLQTNIIPVTTTHPLKLLFARWQYQDNFRYICQGIRAVRTFFRTVHELFKQHKQEQLPSGLQAIITLYQNISKDARMTQFLATLLAKQKLSFFEVFMYDALFRVHLHKQVVSLLEMLYELDVFLAFAHVHDIYQLTYPSFTTANTPLFEAQGLYHLLLENPKPYDVSLDDTRHLLFLTGPNMAGKTTFLKACGLAVYLAHLGMAVPAAVLHLSVYDALVSSINTEENIRLGYSYFYSEVKRMKTIAEHISRQKRAFFLLDELFKGTNIHDAYEASRRAIHGLANWPNHLFLLSSHLVELALDIELHPRFVCKCVDAQITQGIPVYSYELQDGISCTRLGLILLKQEQVFKLLDKQKMAE